MRNETLSQLPWAVAALEETMNPSIEFVVSSGKEALSAINLGRPDIDSRSRDVFRGGLAEVQIF